MVLMTCLSAFDVEFPLNISHYSTVFVLTRDTFLRSSHKLSRVVHIANESLFVVELEKLLFNVESTALCQTKYVSKALYQSFQTTKMNFVKLLCYNTFSKTTIAVRFNPLQISPSIFKFAE